MKINIAEQLLPEVYNRHGKDCYLDPIRQKLIYITPEETVRQRMISYLVNELKVPKGAILVEEHLSHYNVPSKKTSLDMTVYSWKEDIENGESIMQIEFRPIEYGKDYDLVHNPDKYVLFIDGTEIK